MGYIMKVLLINQFPLFGGGSGIYTKNLAKSLTALGHEVQIIIPENTTQIENIEKVKINPVFFNKSKNKDPLCFYIHHQIPCIKIFYIRCLKVFDQCMAGCRQYSQTFL